MTSQSLQLFQEVKAHFTGRFHNTPEVYSQSPGRINIIGEHTDYTGGLSLPAAIDCWTVGAWTSRADGLIKVHSVNMNETWETSWSDLERSIDKQWKKYVAGCLLLFRESQLVGGEPKGLELCLLGDIPLGKGLSSSAAVELAVLNGLNVLYGKDLSPLGMAKLAQQVEHRYLKVKSGLLDQFACQFSQPGGALLIDFQTLSAESVVMGENFNNCDWVLVDSQVKRELAGSKYSERVEEYHVILSVLQKIGVTSIRDLPLEDVESAFRTSGENILRRARHIVSENERTREAVEMLRGGKVRELGRLLYETHISLAQDYEVSHPHLDFMVEASRSMDGVHGGRMMGGGFGGCGLFLVDRKRTEAFNKRIAEEYFKMSGVKTDPRAYRFVGGASAWMDHGG